MSKHHHVENSPDVEVQEGKPKASRSTKLYWMVLILGLALAVGGFFYKDKEVEDDSIITEENGMPEGLEFILDEEKTPVEDSVSYEFTGNSVDGTLQNSDDINRGNLKLVSSLGVIYLRTQRDFQSMVGSEVSVLIDGTLDAFKLVDIVKK